MYQTIGRWAFAAMLGMSLSIGLIVGIASWRATSFGQTRSVLDAADTTIGYAFYDTLDRVLAGEEHVGWTGIVTDDFVDHAETLGTTQSIDALATRLHAFGQVFPGARIDVVSIDANGESLIASVSPVAPASGSVAGLTLAPVHLSSAVEILRIRRGRISERWAMPLPAVSATTLATDTTALFAGNPVHANLYRIQLPPGGEFIWTTTGLSTVMVEDGALSLTLEEKDELGRDRTQREDLGAGAAELLPPVARVRLRGTSTQATRVLLFDAFRSDRETPWPFTRLGGTTSKLLWSSVISLDGAEPWRFAVGNVSIPPNVTIALSNPSAFEIVLAVDGAPIGLTIGEGRMAQLDEQYETVPVASPKTIDGGAAVQLSGVDTMTMVNSDAPGSTVWLITFGPLNAMHRHSATPVLPPGQPERRR